MSCRSGSEKGVLLLEGGTVVTVDEQRRVIPDGSVLVEGNVISAVGTRRGIREKYSERVRSARVIDTRDMVVMPGLVSCHTHVFQTLMRGLADDRPVEEWVLGMVFPFSRRLGERESYVAAQLAILEMIRSGTTCFADSHYIHVDKQAIDGIACAARESGIRAQLVRASLNIGVPDEFKEDCETAVAETLRCIREYHGSANGRLRFCPEALSPVEADEEMIRVLHEVGEETQTGFHMHVAESLTEVREIRRMTGKGVVEYLEELGVLGSLSLFAHCVWVSPHEIRLLAESCTGIAHNPVSNLMLADGIAPIPAFLGEGAKVGIGVDGAASNNSQDMFEAMKLCVLQQRGALLDPQALYPETALELATIRSAEALRWGDEIGSLQSGKRADIVVCDTREPAFCPNFKPVSNIVLAASGATVRTVIVDGRVLMRDREMLTMDAERICATANATARGLLDEASLGGLLQSRIWGSRLTE